MRKNIHRLTRDSYSYAIFLLIVFSFIFPALYTPPISVLAAPLSQPVPNVSISASSPVMIGEDFTLTVNFENTGTVPGYGPFVDLVFPLTGGDGDGDGINYISASYLSSPIIDDVQVFPGPAGGTGCVSHPWLRDSNGDYVDVCGPSGDQFVSLMLPFGSYVPSQPAIDISVSAHLSNFANITPDLLIYGRGGYMFGETPLDDWCCGDTPFAIPNDTDSTNWSPTPITPQVFTFNKGYLGPSNTEDETATGPNFIQQYALTLNIASGQTLTNIVFQDVLPDNVQYVGINTTDLADPLDPTSTTTPGFVVVSEPNPAEPDGTLDVRYVNGTGRVIVVFDFYIPELYDSTGGTTYDDPVINPDSGADESSENIAWLEADWDPLDPDDDPETLDSDPSCPTCPPLHTLLDKSIAIQKSVAVVANGGGSGGTEPIPGAILEYTIVFQVSDYFTFDNMVVTDTISDGQHVRSELDSLPTIQINGNPNFFGPIPINDANYTVSCDYSTAVISPTECESVTNGASGETTLTFDISGEIDDHQTAGTMLGGCVNPVGGLHTPCDPLNLNDGPTEGTIVFQTEILDQFVDDYPSGDISVDQGDVLGNTVKIEGNILDNTSGLVVGIEDDNATGRAEIGREELSKTIFGINDETNSTLWDRDSLGRVRVKPGDKITYRLTYDLLTSDVEDLTFDDYFPLPVFHVLDPDEDGNPGPTWTFSDAGGIPDPGVVTLLDPADPINGDTFYQYMTTGLSGGAGVLSPSDNNPPPPVLPGDLPTQEPVIAANGPANKINIYYANYDDSRNQSTTVDLLFSLIVSDDPFADGLFLTNMAHAFEGSTNSGTNTEDAIVQFVLNEPVLVSQKGIVWTSNTNAVFNPTDVGPAGVTFRDPAHASVPPRWDGTVNSNGLAAFPINSDVSGVDAEDKITFAITIENTGNSLKGAFDIQLRDILNTTYYLTPYSAPGTDLNLQIYYGSDGDRPPPPLDGPIPYRAVDGSCSASGDNDVCGLELFDEGIELIDPDETPPGTKGVCSAYDPLLGNNVILITYDLVIKPNVIPGDAVNTVTLFHYAGEEGGPNHLHPNGPQVDDATASIVGTLEKTLDNTEIDNFASTGTNLRTEVVIGELVTYTLTATVPEGQVPNARLIDQLDGGLAFVSCDSVTVTAGTGGMTTDLVPTDFSGVCTETETSPTGVTNNGQDILFDLGNITNDDRDDNPETIAITYTVVTLNINDVNGNQAGDLLNNQAEFVMNEVGNPDVTLDTASAEEVVILEPQVNTVKLPVSSSGDAGNPVNYTLTLNNPAGANETDAFDVDFLDDFPMCPNPADGSAIHDLLLGAQSGPATFVLSEPGGAGTGNSTGWRLTATGFDMAPSEVATVNVSGTIAYCVPPGLAMTNIGTTTWTSLSGDFTPTSTTNPVPRSNYNLTAYERTGAEGVGGALNGYASQGQSVIDINNTVSDKYLVATSERHTEDPGDGTPRVVVGELVRYRLVVLIPEGTSQNFQIQDYLPPGITFIDDGQAVAIFLYNDPIGGITSSPYGSIPGISDSDCFLTPYNSANATTPAIPATCARLADFNVGSNNSTSADPDSYGTDGDVFIKLGTLRNNDSDGDDEFVVIEFTALVDNNSDPINTNDAGDNLENSFQAFINGTANGSLSNLVEVIVAEPVMNINKTITNLPASEDGNDDIEYTLVIENLSTGFDDATAFDIVLTDTFDPYITALSLDSVIPAPGGVCVGNGSAIYPFNHSSLGSLAGQNLNFTATCLDPGDTITLVISGTLDPDIPAGYDLTNLAELLWTSLPGTGTSPNDTGSTTPGGSGALNGERNGSGGVNDYRDTDNANTTLAGPEVDKDVIPTDYPIGAEFTYDIIVTLPEGITPDMVFYDDIPAGLEYRSHSINSVAYNGTFTNDPTNPANVTTPVGSGGVFSIDFGDTDTVANNNGADDSFLIQLTVRVLNEIGNQNGDILLNQGEIRYSSGTTGTGSVGIRIIEPVLLVGKVTIPSPANNLDAGDTFQYQVTISHDQDLVGEDSLSHAYDVMLTDFLELGSSDILITVINSTTMNGGATIDNPTAITGGGTGLAGQYDIPLGGSVVINYTAELQDSVRPDQTLTNDVDISWSSLNGNPAEARDGSGGVDDYINSTNVDADTRDLLQISKDLIDSNAVHTSNPELTIGEEGTFELVVTVIEGTTDSVVVTDTLPDNINFLPGTLTVTPNGPGMTTGYTAPPTWADPILTVDLGQVFNPGDGNPLNDTITIEFDVLVENDLVNQDGNTKTNNVQVTDGNLVDTATYDIQIVEPVLTIAKFVDDDTPALGQSLRYRIRLENPGPIRAFDVEIEDTLPTGVLFDDNIVLVPGFGCPGTNLVSWSSSTPNQYQALINYMEPGCVLDFFYDAIVESPPSPTTPPIDNNPINNTAEVIWTSGTGADERFGDRAPGGLNDYEVDTTRNIIITNPDLVVIKDDGVGVYVPGTNPTSVPNPSPTYTITVENVGNADVIGGTVVDTFPPEITSTSWTCVGSVPAATCTASGSGNINDTVNIPAGENVTYTVSTWIDSAASGPLTNTASAPPHLQPYIEPTRTNNTSTDEDGQDSHADLAVDKDDFVTIISPGYTTTYTVTVSNTSPSDVTGATVDDPIPPDIDSWTWVCTGATNGANGCDDSIDPLAGFSDTVNLPAGSSITYEVTAQVSSTPTGPLENVVTVSVPSGVTEDNPGDNTDNDIDDFPVHSKTLIAQQFGITGSLTDVAIGEVLTYRVMLNVPVGLMTKAHLIDTLDRGLAFVDCDVISADPGLETNGSTDFSTVCDDPTNPTVSRYPSTSTDTEDLARQVDFDFGTLANTNTGPGRADLTIDYFVVVLDSLENQSDAGLTLTNNAVWIWSSGNMDDQADGVEILEPDLTVSKTAYPTRVYLNQTITFTLTIDHTGISETPAYDLRLTDVIPPELDYVPGSLRHVGGQTPDLPLDDSGAPSLVITWSTFDDSDISQIAFDTTFDPSFRRKNHRQTITNQASLSWTSLPDGVSGPPPIERSTYNPLSTERYYDPLSNTNIYAVSDSAVIVIPKLPDTGFAPGQVTKLPVQREDQIYKDMDNLQLVIPELDLSLPIVSIPQTDQGWDLTWLWDQAGWLEGTAYPSWLGNTVITGHAYLSTGLPGPFVNLASLNWGDEIVLYAHGLKYTYQVRLRELVSADDHSILDHKEGDWITLFTCRDYNEILDEYIWRQVVQAVMIDVEQIE